MTKKIIYTLVDDLDGSTDRVSTYRFAVEGREYEIDLSVDNLARLRAALAPYVAAGRPYSRTARRPRPVGTPAPANQIRRWWTNNWRLLGLPAAARGGPIPHQVREAYDTHR